MDGSRLSWFPTTQLWHIDAVKGGHPPHHCEERDSATKQSTAGIATLLAGDCFASLAMTKVPSVRVDPPDPATPMPQSRSLQVVPLSTVARADISPNLRPLTLSAMP